MPTPNSSSPALFASLGHANAGWLANRRSKKAVDSQVESNKFRHLFKIYLESLGEPTASAHLITLSMKSQEQVYTGIQKSVWSTLDNTAVYIGAFDNSNKDAPVLLKWKKYPSNFTQILKASGVKITHAQDGYRILITLPTNDSSWNEVSP